MILVKVEMLKVYDNGKLIKAKVVNTGSTDPVSVHYHHITDIKEVLKVFAHDIWTTPDPQYSKDACIGKCVRDGQIILSLPVNLLPSKLGSTHIEIEQVVIEVN